MKQIYIFVITLVLLGTASATSESITIIDPANDNPIINSDFDVRVYVNDTNVKSVQARITGFTWINLVQDTSTDWSAKFKIADYPDGAAILTAKYQRLGESIWYYVPATTSITIQKPQSVVQYGRAQFTFKDVNNNPIQGITVQPTGNVSGSDGIVLIDGQPLNTQINFTFTKTEYISSYTLLTFNTNATVLQSITLIKVKPDLKKLRVSGYSTIIESGTMFYLKVKDDATGELINGAQVLTFKDNKVQSIPGNVTNGRITVSFIDPGYYELIMEKPAYEDWSETITVIAPKATPTPSPTPTQTPAPDPNKYRADANMKLTDDEYREWMVKQEEIKRNQTAANQPTTIQPPKQESEFPWTLLGFVVFAIGIVVYKYSASKTTHHIEDAPDVLEHITPTIPSGIKIKCDLCEWTTIVDEDMDETIQASLLDSHKKKRHSAS